MIKKSMSAAIVVGLLAAYAAHAEDGPDTLILEDGRTLTGTVVEENADGVKFKMKFATTTFQKKEVKSIQRGGEGVKHAGDLRDVLVMKNGDRLQGLLVAEYPNEVTFNVIASGANVSKTMLVRSKYKSSEVQELQKLTDEQRAGVLAYFAQVKSQERQEKVSIKAIEIKDLTWPNKDPKGKPIPAGLVELEHFNIESTTPHEFLRECAVRLTKVYNAYQDHFGIERNADQKVRVLIYDSMRQYYGSINNVCKNPAFYCPADNTVQAGCEYHLYQRATEHIAAEFARIEELLQKRTAEVDKARADINRQVNDINLQIRKASADPNAKRAAMDNLHSAQVKAQMQLGAYQKEVDELRAKMDDFKRRLAVEFDRYTEVMFQMLYHESFHAFQQNFLFTEQKLEKIPLWLIEGMAQYFELARIEGDRLVLGREDRMRMALLRKWNKDGGLVKLTDLIVAESKNFMVKEPADIEQSNKHYLQSWFIVHWLGQNNRLSKKNLMDYVDAVIGGTAPADALPLLTGVSNAELQKVMDEKFKYDFDVKAQP